METEDGLLGNPALPIIGSWIPYHSEIRGDFVCWNRDFDPDDPPSSTNLGEAFVHLKSLVPSKANPKGMLDTFIRIKNESDVLRFVQKYGALQLCENGSTVTRLHGPLDGFPCMPDHWIEPLWHERLDHWYSYVRVARGIIDAASALHEGERASEEFWYGTNFILEPLDVVSDIEDPRLSDANGQVNPKWISRQPVARQRRHLASLVEAWLYRGDVQLGFSWGSSGPDFDLNGATFATLGIQLMFAVSKNQRLTICDGCGKPYTRDRKPQRGRRNYCPDCIERGIDIRDRKRRQRANDLMKEGTNG